MFQRRLVHLLDEARIVAFQLCDKEVGSVRVVLYMRKNLSIQDWS